jgi:hypothetical protein
MGEQIPNSKTGGSGKNGKRQNGQEVEKYAEHNNVLWGGGGGVKNGPERETVI